MPDDAHKPTADRDRKGRFAPGNKASKGSGRTAERRERLRKLAASASDDEIGQVLTVLHAAATTGDTTAAQLWLSYVLGKPRPMPHHIETDAIGGEVRTADQAFAILGRTLVEMGAGRLDVDSARVVLGSVGEFAKGLQLIELQRELDALRADVARITEGEDSTR